MVSMLFGLPSDLLVTILILIFMMTIVWLYFFVINRPTKIMYFTKSRQIKPYKCKYKIGTNLVHAMKGSKILTTFKRKALPYLYAPGGLRSQTWFILMEGHPETIDIEEDILKNETKEIENAESNVINEIAKGGRDALEVLNDSAFSSKSKWLKDWSFGVVCGALLILAILIASRVIVI